MTHPAGAVRRLLARLRESAGPDMFFFAVGLATVAAGTWGFQAWRVAAAGPAAADFWDSFYRALQLFALGFDAEESWRRADMPALLGVARLAAAVTLVYAVLRLAASQVLGWIRLSLQCLLHPDRRYVLLGFGALNSAIARELLRRDPRAVITVAAREIDEADRAFARRHRIHMIETDLADRECYAALRLHRCRRVIVACGDDTRNVEVGAAAAAEIARRLDGEDGETALRNWLGRLLGTARPTHPPRRLPHFGRIAERRDGNSIVHVHIGALAMQDALSRSQDIGFVRGGSFDTFSIKEVSAKQLMLHAFPTEIARRHGADRLHLVIVGFGELGEAIMRETFLDGCALGLAPPRVTVIDTAAADIAARVRRRHAPLFDPGFPEEDRVSLRFLQGCAEQLDFEAPLHLRDAETGETVDVEALGPPTMWVFACREDETNLRAGALLDDAMQRDFRPRRPVYVRYWTARLRTPAEDHATAIAPDSPFTMVRPFGALEETVSHLDSLSTETQDALPKYLHARYRMAFAEELWSRLGLERQVPGQGLLPLDPAALSDDATRQAYADVSQKFAGEWAHLPEDHRIANRRLADHAAIVLTDLGFDWHGRKAGYLPRAPRAHGLPDPLGAGLRDLGTASPPPAAGGGTGVLAGLARAEHRRWMIDRALGGWTAQTERGAAKRHGRHQRRHENMVPFEELGPRDGGSWDTRLYDTVLVYALVSGAAPGAADPRRPACRVVREARARFDEAGRLQPVPPEATELRVRLEDIARPDDGGWTVTDRRADAVRAGLVAWAEESAAAMRLVIEWCETLPAVAPEPPQGSAPGGGGRMTMRRMVDILARDLSRIAHPRTGLPKVEIILDSRVPPRPARRPTAA